MSARALIFITVLAISGVAAGAQPVRAAGGPAEVPPADFSDAQYVDSRGCMFVRAGFGGAVVWVPRVGSDRKLLCGFAPSIVTAAPVAMAADVAAVVPATATASPVRRVTSVGRAPVSVAQTSVPGGFRAAWNDGRLNENRGPVTAVGDAAMALIWTNTVPRRLLTDQR